MFDKIRRAGRNRPADVLVCDKSAFAFDPGKWKQPSTGGRTGIGAM